MGNFPLLDTYFAKETIHLDDEGRFPAGYVVIFGQHLSDPDHVYSHYQVTAWFRDSSQAKAFAIKRNKQTGISKRLAAFKRTAKEVQ